MNEQCLVALKAPTAKCEPESSATSARWNFNFYVAGEVGV